MGHILEWSYEENVLTPLTGILEETLVTAVAVLPILRAPCEVFAFHYCTCRFFQNSGEI